MNDVFLQEYSAEDAIKRYGSATAGCGINHLLGHDYRRVYETVLDKHLSSSCKCDGVRVLEFGCGAGMNLIHLMSVFEHRGIRVEQAYGTDFSETLIGAAKSDAKKLLTPAMLNRVEFLVARNEHIVDD